MLIVRDTRFASRREAPPWMEGAQDLHEREDANGRLWGIGNGMFLGPAPDNAWKDLDDGYQCRLVKGFAPIVVLRQPLWCPLHSVVDQRGRQWMVPQILDASGSTLVIQVTYGPGFQPLLSPLQLRAKAAAEWARQTLSALAEGVGAISHEEACRAAADLLCTLYHLSPGILAAESLLDQGFVLKILRVGAGWTEEL